MARSNSSESTKTSRINQTVLDQISASSPILDYEGASAFTTISVVKLKKLVADPESKIPIHKVGSRVLFIKNELVDWVTGN